MAGLIRRFFVLVPQEEEHHLFQAETGESCA